jgi:RHS repeat-associated protein
LAFCQAELRSYPHEEEFAMLRLACYCYFSVLFLPCVVIFDTPVQAKNIGADPASCEYCETCCSSCCINTESYFSFVSLTEGNVSEDYTVANVKSAFGTAIEFRLIYNSYNADNSRASLDTMVGFGWTHTFNDFLFAQGLNMFRMRGDGRIIQYAFRGGGKYQTSAGYFETLVKNQDGSFDVTTKYQTRYHYELIPNTPFLVRGPVLRLTSITDRNSNVTTLSYASGDLTSITDTYGRSFQLDYNSNHHLISIKDPGNNVTTLAYNGAGCLLTAITDPTSHSRTYIYNPLFQMTSMTDRDGRLFTFVYHNNLPYAELDSVGNPLYALTNSSHWATDAVQLALNYMRSYVPSTTRKTDGRGNVWRYTYDVNGHVVTKVAPDGATTTYSYDATTLKAVTTVDANGHTNYSFYDSQGNVVQRIDALGHFMKYTYEPMFNQMTSITDPQGRVTTYNYDNHGNRLSETDPLGGTMNWTYDGHGNVLSFTDKNRNPVTLYTYDANGNLSESDQPLDDTTKFTYDIIGNRTSKADANLHQTQWTYDALYRLQVQTDALNNTRQYFYDNEADRTKAVDENGHATRDEYDLRRRLVTETDALNKQTAYTYDGNNNQASVTDRNGHTTNYSYDVQNRLTRTLDALGDVSARSYDGVGNRVSETDPNGHTTTHQYDALNRHTQMIDALNEVTQWRYDQIGLPGHPECTGPGLGSSKSTEHLDANGKVIYYCYDGLDRLVIEIHKQGNMDHEIDPNDAVTYLSYDANSNVLTRKEPDGNTTTYSYDALNRQVKMVNAAGDTTVTSYDPVGNVVQVEAPNQNLTNYAYDPLNRMIRQTDGNGIVGAWTYDPVGNLLQTTDGDNNPHSYTYDAINRRVTLTDSLAKSIQYSYDNVGNLVEVVDRNGEPTTYAFDAINRRISTTDAQPSITTFQYDPASNLVKIVDGNSHSTSFTYDLVNRRIAEQYPDLSNNTVHYTYDNVGNVISRTDQKAQTTAYTYSDLYFLLQRTYPISPADVFTYDLSGRNLTATRGSWAEAFKYDGADRLTQSIQNGRVITYVYDIPGRLRTLTYPGGRSITENTDFRNQLSAVNDGGNAPIAHYTYDGANNVLTRALRNGTITNYTYNPNNWTCSTDHSFGQTRIAGFSQSYDNENNKSYEQKLHQETDSEAYQYDSIYRLIDYKAGMLASSPPLDCPPGAVSIPKPATHTSYTLDKLGNWTSKDTDNVLQTRMHSPSNEITQIDAVPIVSDLNGSTIDDGTNLYSYDEENRLTKVVDKHTQVVLGQYQYDAFGRRVSKIDNMGIQTFFYYDDWRTVEEQSSMGVTQATYVFGNKLDEVLTMDRIGEPGPFYYHQNTLWSEFALTDSSGKAVEGYSYDAYGYQTIHLPGPDGILWTADDVILSGGKSAYGNPFLFTGQRYDPETTLDYYKNRYYSTDLGRFLTRDPNDYQTGWNLYEYARGGPTKFTDPTGEITVQPIDRYLSADGAKCGDRHFQVWQFILDSPAPCNGYIVQQVQLRDEDRACVHCEGLGSGPETTYYEAWHVKALGTTTDYPTLIYDRAARWVRDETCGRHSQFGVIKFFCDSTTHDLGFEGRDGRWRQGNMGNWKVNQSYGSNNAGNIPSFGSKPNWFDQASAGNEKTGSRFFAAGWCCCDTKNAFSTASPTKKPPTADQLFDTLIDSTLKGGWPQPPWMR